MTRRGRHRYCHRERRRSERCDCNCQQRHHGATRLCIRLSEAINAKAAVAARTQLPAVDRVEDRASHYDMLKNTGPVGEPRPGAVGAGSLSPPPSRAQKGRAAFNDQSLKLRITVGISRSLPKSLDAMGPNPLLPSGRVSPLRKKGGS